MASVIKIKRRLTGSTGSPASLMGGELAYNEVNDVLYYGKGDNGSGVATSIVQVGGVSADYVTLVGAQTISGDKTFSGFVDLTGAFKIDGTEVTASAGELNRLAGITAGVASEGKALVVDGNKDLNLNGGDLTVQDLIVSGNLTVNGTQTVLNTETLQVADKQIEIAKVETPSDATAADGGIVVKGTTDKSLLWKSATSAFTSSENLDLVDGKKYHINGVEVLSSSALGSGVTSSSLTSLGVVSSGTWQATAVAISYGGTGAANASDARTNLGVAIGSDVQAYSSVLAGLAGGATTANSFIYFDGSSAAANATLTSFARGLLDDSSASDARTTLGVSIGSDVQAYSANLAALSGLTSASDKGMYFTGSGSAATYDLSSFGRTLAGSADAAGARSSLGLGTMAVQNADSVAITGGTIDGVTLDGGSY